MSIGKGSVLFLDKVFHLSNGSTSPLTIQSVLPHWKIPKPSAALPATLNYPFSDLKNPKFYHRKINYNSQKSSPR